MPNLTTTYLGLELSNPLVASPSPWCEDIVNLRRMEEAGVAAIVLHSLFEEQINMEHSILDRHLAHTPESYAESLSYFPDLQGSKLSPEAYVAYVSKAKEAVNIPVIGSLNGVSSGGWIEYAKAIEEAGADALELNLYYIPTDPMVESAEVERIYLDVVREVRSTIDIPLAVKIGPYFSAMANMARRFDEIGVDALVLFNRFYQPDFDLDTLEVVPNLQLSAAEELRLRLRWAAILHGHIRCDMAITGGVHDASDVLKSMMAGAKVAMMTSAILRNGIDYFRTVLEDLRIWMEEHEYESVKQMQGSMSQRNVAEPAAFERANYLKVLGSYTWGVTQ
jgi:dihydroorotate dehydrogenase (fumarate)